MNTSKTFRQFSITSTSLRNALTTDPIIYNTKTTMSCFLHKFTVIIFCIFTIDFAFYEDYTIVIVCYVVDVKN